MLLDYAISKRFAVTCRAKSACRNFFAFLGPLKANDARLRNHVANLGEIHVMRITLAGRSGAIDGDARPRCHGAQEKNAALTDTLSGKSGIAAEAQDD